VLELHRNGEKKNHPKDHMKSEFLQTLAENFSRKFWGSLECFFKSCTGSRNGYRRYIQIEIWELDNNNEVRYCLLLDSSRKKKKILKEKIRNSQEEKKQKKYQQERVKEF